MFAASNIGGFKADGMLGLSPKYDRELDIDQEMHLFVEELAKDDAIKRAAFAIFMAAETAEN